MASKLRPSEAERFIDRDQAIQFGVGPLALLVWPDPRDGVNIATADNAKRDGKPSLHLLPRDGQSLQVVATTDDHSEEQ